MKHSLTGILLLLALIACDKEEKKPDYLWEEERFVEILTEFQKTESVVRLGYHRFKDSAYANDSIYAAFYAKMKVSQADFDSNYQYYLKDPEKMEKIYEEVITNLSEEAADLEGKKEVAQ